MSKRRGAAAVFVLSLLASEIGCRRGVVEPSHSPPGAVDAEAGAHASPDAGPIVETSAALRPVLADPRMSTTRAALRRKDARAAAVACLEVSGKTELSAQDRCAFSHLAGRLSMAAGDFASAGAAFARASQTDCPLASYAKLGAARAAVASRAFDTAATLAEGALQAGLAAEDEARMVRADALASAGRRPEALPLWRKVLESAPKGPHWVEAAGRASSALADGDDAPAHAHEAYALATRVLCEAPHRAEQFGAKATRTRAAALAKLPVELGPEERAALARGWLEAGDAARALSESSALFADPQAPPKVACAAAIVRAQATAKSAKSAAQADAWGDAFPKCDADPELATALFAGAKASASAKRPQEAIFRFGEVERRFPSHRLADDSALRAALLVEEHGNRAEAIEKLSQLPDRYPSGDMRGEALFRAALFALRANDDLAAKPLLERVDALLPDDRHWATAGRASFFRARIAERAGDVASARSLDARVVEHAPLSFYMARSYARTAERDADGARTLLSKLGEKDKVLSFGAPSRELLESAPFRRAVRLLEVNDLEAARREFVAAHALGDGAAPELVWTVGALFDRVEAWDVGHAFARGRVHDHLAHFPEGPFRSLWETAYPRAFAEDVARASVTHGVRESLVWGIMREESSFMAEVRSPANAYGLMQLLPSTAKWISAGAVTQEADLKRPEVSIDLGSKLLAQLLGLHRHPALAIAAYNAGSGAVQRWMSSRTTDELELFVELIPYEETRNYVKRVLGTALAYAYLYDPGHLDDVLRVPSKVVP